LAYLYLIKTDYDTPYYKNHFYHIYNRGNNSEKIFYKPNNYYFFLKRFEEYLSECIDTFAYCRLPNHFHLLVKINEKLHVNEKFRLLFLSYSKSINKQLGRTGSLFQKRYIRTIIESISSLCRVAIYIHTNPVHHKITSDFENYRYSSFQSLLSNKETLLKRDDILKWFTGRHNFIKLHKEKFNLNNSENYFIED
jgi:REP element-mobilizing transposase RayT